MEAKFVGKSGGTVGRIVAVVVWAMLLILAALWLAPRDAGAQGGTVPPAPEKQWTVLLPMISDNAFPAVMPPMIEGEPSYQTTPVNVDVWMGGEAGSTWEWMRASTLLTFWNWREDGRRDAVICWYGIWATGAGAARCELYPVGE